MTAGILVWNPNPTLDVVSVVRTLSPGMVHRAHEQLLTPGGKGTLVVRGLRLLGVECEGVAPLAGQSGALARALLDAEQLPFRVSDVSGMTRVAVTVADEANGSDTVVNGPGPDTGDAAWRRHVSSVREMIASSRFRYFVGCGDAFLAGLVAGLIQDGTGRTALRYGVSAASASAEDLRPGFFSPARVRSLQPMVELRAVSAGSH